MSAPAFTPGPWMAQSDVTLALSCLEQLANLPLSISLEQWSTLCGPILAVLTAVQEAENPRLIAAAPDMLEALREARYFMMAPAEDLLWGVIGRMDAAIAKAVQS